VQNALRLPFRLPLILGLLATTVTLDACRGGSGTTGAAGSSPAGVAGTGAAGSTGAAGVGGEAGTGAAGTGSDVDGSVTDGAAGTGAPAFTKEALLGAFGTCAATRAHTFRERAAALDVAVKALVAAPGAPAQTAAREAFNKAMEAWQPMDVLQYGPTASSLVTGGRDLRDNIYAWPLFGRCAVEEGMVAKTYEAATFGTQLVNRRGLAALDYLLFYEGVDSGCTAGTPEEAAWNALSVDERAARKRAYAAAAAADVLKRAVALDEAWDPAKGNFVGTMRSAGPGNTTYATAQAAIQTVGIALFYLDATVKDAKLGEPLNALCAKASCLETPFSAQAKANIRHNLEAARLLLEGCDGNYAGLGFDDLLASVGAPAVAATLHTQLVAAQAALDAIEEPELGQAMAQDKASVQALRDAVAAITTTLKTTFVTVLGFELTSIPTDNDT
jgi:predicted lipoprotein